MTARGEGGPRVAIVAGEASGDLLGAGLMRALRERRPGVRFEGIAGPRMLAEGCRGLYPLERLSVMGLFESFGRYPELIPVRRRLARDWAADPPDVFVGIDAPDFNLTLELALREAGIATVHYVSPSVWAWRRYRLRKIRRAVDIMLTLFPFEASFYAEHGMTARFVGHPLADDLAAEPDRAAARRSLGLPPDRPLVALLPGSRMSEVRYLAAPLAGAARWLAARRPDVGFVSPLVDPGTRACFAAALAELPDAPAVHLLDGGARDAMAAADVVLAASGTATLEALLLGRPVVITYRTNPLTWLLGRRLLHVEHVGLPNLLAGRRLVPELLQGECRPHKLGGAVLDFLEHPDRCEALREAFGNIRATLRNDASARAAEAVLEVAVR